MFIRSALYHTAVIGILNVLLMFSAGAVPVYIIMRVKNKELRLFAAALSAFAILHGLYHLAFLLGQPVLAVGLLQPLSVLFLLAFAFLLLGRG